MARQYIEAFRKGAGVGEILLLPGDFPDAPALHHADFTHDLNIFREAHEDHQRGLYGKVLQHIVQ